ncbi:S9 family peptidase [Shewanella sp. Scap07]|uniref:S9 family peptidase n=1 Tax=Shewanella sp. Scap07 TaxID=2589987 RepID=UPI0015BAE101|nr:S9 family peptidase [Shewanella sp. Scap07]
MSHKLLLSSLLLTASAISGLMSGCSTQQQQNLTHSAVAPVSSTAAVLPIEAFFNEQGISDIQTSNDGKWLAFLKDYQGAKNLYLMPVGAALSDAQVITQYSTPIAGFQWSLNDNQLFFAKDTDGNENTQLYKLTFDATKAISAQIQPLTDQVDSRYILLRQPKLNPEQLIVMANHSQAQRLDLYRLNIKDGSITPLMENTLGFGQIEVNDSGEPVLAANSNPDNTRNLYINEQGQWRVLLSTDFGEEIDILRINTERNIAFVKANIQGRDKQQLLSIDLTTGKLTTLHQDPRDESDVHEVLFDDAGSPIAVSYYGGRLRTYPLNQEFKQHWRTINDHFKRDVEITVSDRNQDTGLWQLHVASDTDLGNEYVYDANTGKVSVLLAQQPSINPSLLSNRQSIHYTARDGVTIQAYLTLPQGQSKQLPTIILPHGGPWARDYWTLGSGYFNPVAQLLANRGYAVLQPNFRASTGFGKRFLNLGNKNWGTGSMQDDLTDGVNYLVEQGIADKQRVGIMGASYGGYAALAGVTFTPDVYQAAISYVGPSSLITLMEAFPDYYRPYLGQFYNAVGDPEVAADRTDMQARSPINFVDNIKTPLLLVQGANDPRVTQIESDNIAKALVNKSLPVEYILAKDEGHGFQKRDNKLAYILAMERFFAKHLGGKVSPTPSVALGDHLQSLTVDVKAL